MNIVNNSLDNAYIELVEKLFDKGHVSVSRKGEKLYELYDEGFILTEPMKCYASCRNTSLNYLRKEFEFYMSGSDKLEDAIKCSSFWKNCSDDGETINSNYGKRIFHDVNSHGFTQFQHALNCLRNNLQSKKAVIVITSPENAYLSNDNFCTMHLRARVDGDNKLHLTAYMRSNDVFFGTVYDVPFFVFVQLALIHELNTYGENVTLGTYTHLASSLHMYERNRPALERVLRYTPKAYSYDKFDLVFRGLVASGLATVRELSGDKYMAAAWEASKASECLKKKVGACLTTLDDYGNEKFLVSAHGGVDEERTPCTECVRDTQKGQWFGDFCPSVHSEMRCLMKLSKAGITPDMSTVTCYVTAGPCDACLKMLDHAGVRTVYYDKPYKTDYSHWPNITVMQIRDKR